MNPPNTTFSCRGVHWILLASLPLWMSCGKKSSDSPAGAAAPSAKSSSKKGIVIDGEHFTTRVVQDTTQKLPLAVFIAPEKWKDQSQVIWNYEHFSNPVFASYSVENPANEEAVYGFPAARFVWVTPNHGLARPGQNSMGLIIMQRIPADQALLQFVQQTRGRMPNFKIVGAKQLPDLGPALNVPESQGRIGVALKVTYDLNGHPVEEEFYSVPYTVDIPYDGPRGRSYQNNWGLDYLHSFRAPAGTLEKRRAVFAAIPKSFRVNPDWRARAAAIQKYLGEQFDQQLKAGYDQIAAAGRLSRQLTANSDAMLASIDRQLQASRNSSSSGGSSGNASTRSSTDNFDDYIRGVDTVNDPYYGTSQHSLTEQYHWTDGYGNYRNSNDASYNPNHHENGDWQLMDPAR